MSYELCEDALMHRKDKFINADLQNRRNTYLTS